MSTARNISPAFALLLFVIPGSSGILLGGSYLIAGVLPYLLIADVKPELGWLPSLLVAGAGGAAVALGHFMLRIGRIFRADPRDLHPSLPFKKRARCGLALLFSSIILVAAAFGTGISIQKGYRASLAANSVLLSAGGYAVHRLIRYRRKLLRGWEQELLELSAGARAESDARASHKDRLP
jgi:hypothetical protein